MLKIATALSAAIAIINRSLQLRNPSRCTPPRCLPQAQCLPHPRTPSLPHTFTTLPPPTRHPTPPRRRPTAPIPPDSATGSAQFLPPTRKPHRAAPPQRASSPRAVPPHRRLPHPQRRPPSRPVGKRRSIIATVPDHDNPIPPLLCAWRAWLIYYATHVRGYAVLPGVDFRRHALSALWISPESPSVTPYGNKAKFTKLSWRYMQRMPVSFKRKPARNPSADASHRGNRKCALQA